MTLNDLKKIGNLHCAIVGAFAFAFITAGLLAYIPDIPWVDGEALVYSGAALGLLLGKTFIA